jgi:hypothetical protein
MHYTPVVAEETVTANMAATAATAAIQDTHSPDLAAIRAGQAIQPVFDPGIPGSESAFVVPFVSAKGGQVGYVVVSATTASAPILRMSSGSWTGLQVTRRAAAAVFFHQAILSWRTFHLDVLSEVARFTTASGAEYDMLLDTGQIGRFAPPPAVRSAKALNLARAQWGSLLAAREPHSLGGLEQALAPVAYADPTEQKQLTAFPNYAWYHGCSPTAGMMALGYWAGNGYPSLMASTDYYQSMTSGTSNTAPTPGTGPDIIKLAGDMGTDSSGSTYLSSIASGLGRYQSNSALSSSVDDIHNPSYTQLLSYITRGDPIVGSFIDWLYYSFTGTSYDGYAQASPPQRINHTVAIYGYYIDVYTNAEYMVLHDDAPEDGSNYVAWDGNWSQSQFDVPRPFG